MWDTDGGVYLGLQTPTPDRPLLGHELAPSIHGAVRSTWIPSVNIHEYTGERHILTIGPQGSGKTRKLLLPNLYKLLNWSIVVVDPKGELAAHTALHRGKHGRVVIFDPFESLKQNYPNLDLKTSSFNPLSRFDENSVQFIDDIRELSASLIQQEGGGQRYWTEAAQALVRGLLMALRIGGTANLPNMRDTLGMEPGALATFIKTELDQYGPNWPALVSALSEFSYFAPEDREIGGVRRTAKVQTDWLDSPQVRATLFEKPIFPDDEPLDFRMLKEAPMTVYLVIPPNRIKTHGAWLRLMLTCILQPLLDTVEGNTVPVLFMLDEFAQIGTLPIIENNLAQMRGYGIKIWTIWQFLGQAKRLYKDGWEAFLSTAGIKLCYSPDDVETREYFSSLSGEKLFLHKTHSESHQHSRKDPMGVLPGSRSLGETLQNERVIKPYELAALDADECMIFSRRGRMQRSITPQPDLLPWKQAYLDARTAISSRPVAPKASVSSRPDAPSPSDRRASGPAPF